MAEPFDWSKMDIAQEATLVLGFRPRPGSKELVAGRVEIDRKLRDRLLGACRGWIDDLRNRTMVPYEPELHLESDEYLSTSLVELSAHSALRYAVSDTHHGGGTELSTILSSAFSSDDWFTADELRRNFLFYAIVARLRNGGSVAFVKQSSPQRVAKTGGMMTIFDDTLSEVTQPVFVLEPDIDIVVHDEQVAVLRPLAFERLFADLELSRELIPVHIDAVTRSLAASGGLGDALERVTTRKTRARRLLRELSSYTPEQWDARTAPAVREVLEKRDLDPDDYFDENGRIATQDGNVATLLDVLTSRLFTSDFDHEEMRADKVRHRT